MHEIENPMVRNIEAPLSRKQSENLYEFLGKREKEAHRKLIELARKMQSEGRSK